MDHWSVHTESSGVPSGGIGDDVFLGVFFDGKKSGRLLTTKNILVIGSTNLQAQVGSSRGGFVRRIEVKNLEASPLVAKENI